MLLVQSRLNWNNLLGAVSSQVLKISKVRLQNILGHAASVFEPTSWKCFLLVSKQNSLHFSLRFLGLSLHISENSLFLPSLYLPIRNFYTLTRTPLQIQGEQSWLSGFPHLNHAPVLNHLSSPLLNLLHDWPVLDTTLQIQDRQS